MKTLLKRIREPFNCLSHSVGGVLAVCALIPLFYFASDTIQYFAVGLYGFSLCLLYLSSALYHGLKGSEEMLYIFQRLDRIAIYCLIAGTTSPIALISLNGRTGWLLFGLIWGIALAGIILSSIDPFDSRWPDTIFYLVTGWVSIAFIKPIFEAFTLQGFLWCLVGGVLYSVGAIIYATDWPKLHSTHFGAHELWHVFVMLGSGTHFVFVFVYTL